MRYKMVLYFYSVFISTIFLAWLLFSQNSPSSYVFLLLFLPIPFYFWISVFFKHKKESPVDEKGQVVHSANEKTLSRLFLLILVVLFTSTSSIIAYSFFNTSLNTTQSNEAFFNESNSEIKKLAAEITSLKKEVESNSVILSDLVDSSKNNDGIFSASTLGTTTIKSQNPTNNASESAGVIKINGEIASVYLLDSVNSTVLGKAEHNKLYTYTQKKDGWYFIYYTTAIQGWVMSKFANEL